MLFGEALSFLCEDEIRLPHGLGGRLLRALLVLLAELPLNLRELRPSQLGAACGTCLHVEVRDCGLHDGCPFWLQEGVRRTF
jgi:hypothetical protein